MNKTLSKAVILAATLALVAGCNKRRPEDLPPAPGTEVTTPADDTLGTVDQGDVGSTDAARQEAFLRAVNGSDRIFFDTDDYSIDAQDRAILDLHAQYLVSNPGINATVEGHADERGTREYNLALGDRRANAAKNYLVARGVDASRLTVISWGKERPVALGSDESAWSVNRRAVTIITR